MSIMFVIIAGINILRSLCSMHDKSLEIEIQKQLNQERFSWFSSLVCLIKTAMVTGIARSHKSNSYNWNKS